MPTAVTLRAPVVPDAKVVTEKRYQLPVDAVVKGMFVAELDRPWLDTPFLLQGFLVDSEPELEALRKYCGHVFVDLKKSDARLSAVIRLAEIVPRPVREKRARLLPTIDSRARDSVKQASVVELPPDPVTGRTASAEQAQAPSSAAGSTVEVVASGFDPARDDDDGTLRTSPTTTVRPVTSARFREFVKATAIAPMPRANDEESVIERAWGWLRASMSTENLRMHKISRRQRKQRAEIIHAAVGGETVPYADTRDFDAELPRARETLQRSDAVVDNLLADVRSGRIPDLEAIDATVEDIVSSMADNPDALMWVARLREETISTYYHGVKVSLYMVALGRHLAFPKEQLWELGMIGMLADAGKALVPRLLLNKPGLLTAAEFAVVQEHVELGLSALKADVKQLPPKVIEGIAQHHERMNGSGYPSGLKGNEISIYGRMAAIADSFAALITPRPYANPVSAQDAMMNLYEWADTSFHAPLVEQFVQAIGIFPVGTQVELSTGEVAVVVAHNRVRRLEPRVLVLTGPDKVPLTPPVERNLHIEGKNARAEGSMRIVRGLPAGSYGLRMRDYYLDSIAKANGLPV